MSREIGGNVHKYGGFMMRDAEMIRRSVDYVHGDPDVRLAFFSAPGETDTYPKVTNTLLRPFPVGETIPHDEQRVLVRESFDQVRTRMERLGLELGCPEIGDYMEDIQTQINLHDGVPPQGLFVGLSGEGATAKMMSMLTRGTFVDAADLIKKTPRGMEVMTDLIASDPLYVIPGYYYGDHQGNILLLDRGGTDTAAAIVANKINAKLIKNIKDVNGVAKGPPKVIGHDKVAYNSSLTYQEIRELALGGSEVLQTDTVVYLFHSGIPVLVMSGKVDGPNNPFDPNSHTGTLITRERDVDQNERVVGITGKAGYLTFRIFKVGMDDMKGIGSDVYGVLKKDKISYVRTLDQTDTISVTVAEIYREKTEKVIYDLAAKIHPDSITVENNLGMISMVGQGLQNDDGEILLRAVAALRDANIKIRLTSYPDQRTSFTLGVDSERVNEAIGILYNALV